jgi:hypothetical protein
MEYDEERGEYPSINHLKKGQGTQGIYPKDESKPGNSGINAMQ